MFPNIDTETEMEAIGSLLNSRSLKNLSSELIMEGLEICLLNNNSRFANMHLLQINGTATGVRNSCSCSAIAISHLDKIINEKRASQFQECFCFMTVWFYDVEISKKINDFHKMFKVIV